MVHVLDPANPVDGDADRIDSYSRYYGDIAAAIQATTDHLASIVSTTDTESDAVDAFVEVALEVRGYLVEIDERYDTLATQLATYASHLRSFQGDASALMAAARHTHSDYDSTAWNIARLRQQIEEADPADPSLGGLRYNLDRSEDHLRWIEQVVDAKNTELAELLERWRSTADAVASAIDDAVDGSSLNDSGWDKFLDLVETIVTKVLPVIEMVLDILALVLTIAAFILAVTGVGAPLAAALFTVARAAQLVSKIVKIARITLTVLLVASGKMAPTALVDIALDMALDKVLGKAGDKIGDAALAGVKKSGAGEWLAERAGHEGSLFLTQNLDQMVNGGFDEWANNGFKEFMEVGFEDGASWISPTFEALDTGLTGTDAVLDGFLEAHGLTFPSGPDLPHGAGDFKGMGWDLVETSISDISVGDHKVEDFINVPDIPDMRGAFDAPRPSAADLIGASHSS